MTHLNPTIADMPDVILHNIDLYIQKATFEQPSGWQFKNRNYKKFKDIITNNISIIDKNANKIKSTSTALALYEEMFKRNNFKSPSTLKKIEKLYNTYYLRLQAGGSAYEGNEFILEDLREFADSPSAGAIQTFSNIYGIGPAKIKTLITKNILTIEQLRDSLKEEPKILNNKQKMGLRHYEDLIERIPRSEITSFNRNMLKLLKDNYNNDISMTITGSYRRGAKTSGDIDMLITSRKYEGKALDMVLKLLMDQEIICENLAKGKKKFMGVIRVTPDSKARHLDIIETTPNDYPYAMLYFTGSAQHNIKMRRKALTLGYSLNEYDMTIKGTKTRVPAEKIREKIGKDECETEEDIFKFLDMKYKDPKKRVK
jgi:DNA polymerase/3'-5' exonuclease PolX